MNVSKLFFFFFRNRLKSCARCQAETTCKHAFWLYNEHKHNLFHRSIIEMLRPFQAENLKRYFCDSVYHYVTQRLHGAVGRRTSFYQILFTSEKDNEIQ